MPKLIHGERIARTGNVLLGCSAVVFDEQRRNILIIKRTDNGRWCLPGGALDSGESVTEACVREVHEETGLDVEVVRLIGVYSDPHRALEYADGNRYHLISLNFETSVLSGELTKSDETSDFMWISPDQIESVDFMEHHIERVSDAMLNERGVIVK